MTSSSMGLLIRGYSLAAIACGSLWAGVAQALPPVITSTGPTSATVDSPYTYQVLASDPEGGPLTYSLHYTPPSMTISATGEINWTPVRAKTGQQAIQIRVTDNEYLITKEYVYVTVVDPNNLPPVIGQQPVTQTNYGNLYTYDLQATDGNGDQLTYQVWSWPAVQGLGISNTGIVSWTPTRDDVGEVWITVEVDDGHAGVIRQDYKLTVIDPDNHIPAIGQQPVTQTN